MVIAFWEIVFAKSMIACRIGPPFPPSHRLGSPLAVCGRSILCHHTRMHSLTAHFALQILSFLHSSSFVLRHSCHPAKKKMPVSTAFMINIASKACTTEVVVACPTPSAPPSTVSPALHAIVITIQANTTLLIIPEYKSQGSALCSASKTYPAVLKSRAKTQTAQPPRMPI